MKKLVVITIMAAMLLAVSVAVMADATNWMFKIAAMDTANASSAGDCTIGWYKNYTNAIDGTAENVNPVAPPSGGKNAVAASIFPGTGNDFTMRDFRTPLALDPTLPKIWTIAIFTQGNWTDSKIRVTFKPQTSTPFPATDPAFPPGAVVKFTSADYNATYSVADFATKVGVATTWSFDISATDGQGKLYTADNPYYLEVMVPEPSSMLALASGLAGLVGFGIRRRRA